MSEVRVCVISLDRTGKVLQSNIAMAPVTSRSVSEPDALRCARAHACHSAFAVDVLVFTSFIDPKWMMWRFMHYDIERARAAA
jgi:hypothetical protein